MSRWLLAVLAFGSALAVPGCVSVRHARCDDELVDLATSAQHCGKCHLPCPDGLGCLDGACAPVPAGSTLCSAPSGLPDELPETLRPGEEPPATRAATGNGSSPPDPEWREDAERAAADFRETMCRRPAGPPSVATAEHTWITRLGEDPANCGACGRACPEGASCVGGACRCPPGRILCERSSGMSPSQLSAVWPSASPAAQRHEAWAELCAVGRRTVRSCADIASDPTSCGACGRRCPPGEACREGKCVPPAVMAAP